MSDSSFEAIVEAACLSGGIPGVAFVASDATGKFNYAKAFGKTTQGETVSTDSLMWIASCTKLMTAVAAMQQVEQGKVGLDDDTEALLPELASIKILEGFDKDGNPIFREREGKITLRQLLTHSSGLCYPSMHPDLSRLDQTRTAAASSPRRTITTELADALSFEPDSAWTYGVGIDWAGKLVERLTGTTLDAYLQAHVLDPLGVRGGGITFRPELDPALEARKVGMSARDPTGLDRAVPAGTGWYLFTRADRDDVYGGSAAWGDAQSYLTLLRSLCADDGRLLGSEALRELLRPQLVPAARDSYNGRIRSDERARRIFGNVLRHEDLSLGGSGDQEFDYAPGGSVILKDVEGRRKAGTVSWGGVPNLFWWIDPKTGLCGALFTQLVPPGDEKVLELLGSFEKYIYKMHEDFQRA